ncbi:hypothetical protein [Kingella denitrificans]|uniref:hypothetical protein n=1 Tax=Kingella denitrificans TaxID=502 RepID=UPI0021C3ADF1|nr:hypothetical protein [Kingella denitrificans]
MRTASKCRLPACKKQPALRLRMTESAESASMSADSAAVAKDMSVMRLQSARAEERLGTR